VSALPGVVEGLLDRWDCRADGNVMHGAVGVIVPVLRDGSALAVLKVSFPHPGNVHEPDAFAAWDGHGAVRLYERDDERFGLLLERADPTTLATIGDVDQIASAAGQISGRLTIPAPAGLPRLQERAGTWEKELRADDAGLAHAIPARAIDAAIATIRELGAIQPDTLIHGDLHAGNILRAQREPWLAVDPKGLAGDPGYDGGTFGKTILPWLANALDLGNALDRTLGIFAEAAGLDAERVRRWAQLLAVQGAFWERRHGGPGMAWLTTLFEEAATLLAG
jgi:streptomycin 6-kinase